MYAVYDSFGRSETVMYSVDAQELMKTDPRWIGFHKIGGKEAERTEKEFRMIKPVSSERDYRSKIIERLDRNNIKPLSPVRDTSKRVHLVCGICQYKFQTVLSLDIQCPRCHGIGRSKTGVDLVASGTKKKTTIDDGEIFDACEYYSNSTKVPVKKSDFLTIVCTADTVKKDVKKWGIHGDVAAVNDAGFYLPNYNHFVSIHGSIIPLVYQYKILFRNYEKHDFLTHSAFHKDVGLFQNDQDNADFVWRFSPIYRSSGMLAVFVAIAIGYRAILIHGMTMDERDHYYDLTTSYVRKNHHRLFSLAESGTVFDIIKKHNVVASSGRFSDIIGKTTKKWIDDNKRYI